jgi:hypothetical protein
MNPYRKYQTDTKIISKKAPKLRTLYRKFLIWINGGNFLKRNHLICHVCNKRSYGLNINRSYFFNYYKCGHKKTNASIYITLE